MGELDRAELLRLAQAIFAEAARLDLVSTASGSDRIIASLPRCRQFETEQSRRFVFSDLASDPERLACQAIIVDRRCSGSFEHGGYVLRIADWGNDIHFAIV